MISRLSINTIIIASSKHTNIKPKQSAYIVWALGLVLWVTLSIGLLPAPLAAATLEPVEHAERAGHDDLLDAGLLRDEALCGPTAYRIGDTELCTYGPEVIQADPAEALRAAAQASPGHDAIRCEGDGVSGQRVQVLYVRAADQRDRYADSLALIRQVALDADLIFDQSAHQTGDHRRIRYVTDADCQLAVLPVVLHPGEDATFAATVTALRAQGLNKRDRKYLIFMEANVYCGLASAVDDDRPGAANRSNLITGYARVDRTCWSSKPVAHEVAHMLGSVQHSAPNASGGWHCTDGNDLLCYSDTPYFPQIRSVCTDTRYLYLLDCNNDDYFHTNPPADSYLAEHWNLADSAFLIKMPEAHAALPLMRFSVPTAQSQLVANNEIAISVALLNPEPHHSEPLIQHVEFFQEGVSLGRITEAPYELTWQPTAPGHVTLTARVTDRHGFTQTLEPVSVQIMRLNVHSEQLEQGGTWVTLLPMVSNEPSA